MARSMSENTDGANIEALSGIDAFDPDRTSEPIGPYSTFRRTEKREPSFEAGQLSIMTSDWEWDMMAAQTGE